jgi:hypothetical protein
MHSAFCKFWISVVGIAVVTSVAGCGGNDAPQASSASSVTAPGPSSPPVDVEAAFAQVKEAVKPFWCSNAYSDMGDMADAGNIDAMRLRVHEYRGVMTTWDDDLSGITVPPAAQPIVDKIGELNAAETADLDALAGVNDKDKKQIDRLLARVYYDDALVAVQAHHLSAALGHPEPQGQIAADQLEVANQTYYTEQLPFRWPHNSTRRHNVVRCSRRADSSYRARPKVNSRNKSPTDANHRRVKAEAVSICHRDHTTAATFARLATRRRLWGLFDVQSTEGAPRERPTLPEKGTQ